MKFTVVYKKILIISYHVIHSIATNTDRQVFKYFPNTPSFLGI